MANANFRGRYLHEGVSNLQSSKEFTGQFVSVLSNGEDLSVIQASLNFIYKYKFVVILEIIKYVEVYSQLQLYQKYFGKNSKWSTSINVQNCSLHISAFMKSFEILKTGEFFSGQKLSIQLLLKQSGSILLAVEFFLKSCRTIGILLYLSLLDPKNKYFALIKQK